MRALITAALAAALISSVSACRFQYGNQWVTCNDGGSDCVAATPTPTPAPAKPTAKPIVIVTAAPTASPTAAPVVCTGGMILDSTTGLCVGSSAPVAGA